MGQEECTDEQESVVNALRQRIEELEAENARLNGRIHALQTALSQIGPQLDGFHIRLAQLLAIPRAGRKTEE